MDEEDPGESNGLWECVCMDDETIQLDINWIVEHSGYFSGLMRSDMRETKQKKLNLCLFSADTVAFLIELFSYRNKKQSMMDLEDTLKTHFSFNNVEEVLRLIDYLDIPCLYPKCCEMLNELIPSFCSNIRRLWKFWVLCDDYNLQSVEKQMSTFLVKQLQDFVEMDDLFLKELPMKLFEGMLSEEGLDVKSELGVMSMIETWISYNKDHRLEHFDDLFKCVSIPSMIHAEWNEIQEKVSKLTGKTIDLHEAYSRYVRNPHIFLTDFPHMNKSRNAQNVIISFGGIYEYSIRNIELDMGTGRHNRYRMSSLPMFYVMKDEVFEGTVSDNYQVNVEDLSYKRRRRSSRLDNKRDIDMKQFPDLKSPVRLVEFGFCTYEGFVYVIGGQRQMNDAAIFSVKGGLRLDPNRGDWQEVRCMNEGRCLFCLLPVWNRIYAIGGANEYGTLQSTVYYLPLEDTWKEGPDLPTPLYKHAGCVLENSIYISGGHNDAQHTDKVWFLDNQQGPWKPAAPLLRSRSYHSMAAVNGKLYVVGGASCQQNAIKDIYSVEEYDPKTDIWTNVMQLNVPIGDCLPIISDHQLLFIGGYSFSEKVYLQQAVSIDTKQKKSKVSAVTFPAKTPVCLENVLTIPSLNNPGVFDWKFSSTAKVTSAKDKVKFPYSQNKPKERETVTIEQIVDTCTEYDKVDVIAKVIQISTPILIKDNLTKVSTKVADHSGSLSMALWNEHIQMIQIGQTYKMKCITVRQYNNQKNLTSNLESLFEKVDNIEEVHQDDTNEPFEIKLSIDSANVESKTTCPFCNCVVLCNQDLLQLDAHPVSGNSKQSTCCPNLQLQSVVPILNI